MTESMPNAEMWQAPADGFDVWHPAWPAELVTFLASPAAGDVNGQGFIVYGGEVILVQGWHAVAQIRKEGAALTAADLVARKDELFGDLPRTPPF